MATPPNTTTSPAAVSTLSTRRRSAQLARSRSWAALATATTSSRRPPPASSAAIPATAIRGGSPNTPASSRGMRTEVSPRASASSSGAEWIRPPSGARKTVSPARWSSTTSAFGRSTLRSRPSRSSASAAAAGPFRAGTSALASVACASPSSSSAWADSRTASQVARPATSATTKAMAPMRPNLRVAALVT